MQTEADIQRLRDFMQKAGNLSAYDQPLNDNDKKLAAIFGVCDQDRARIIFEAARMAKALAWVIGEKSCPTADDLILAVKTKLPEL